MIQAASNETAEDERGLTSAPRPRFRGTPLNGPRIPESGVGHASRIMPARGAEAGRRSRSVSR